MSYQHGVISMRVKMIIAVFSLLLCILFYMISNSFFNRPTLSKDEYIFKILYQLPSNSVVKVDYIYHSTVGGYGTVARVECSDEISNVFDKMQVSEKYMPNSSDAELLGKVIEGRLLLLSEKGKEPVWLKIPLDNQINIYRVKKQVSTDEYYWIKDKKLLFFVGTGKYLESGKIGTKSQHPTIGRETNNSSSGK